MIKERKISFVDNTLRKAEGDIQRIAHFLYLKKEGRSYVISLHENKTRTRINDKSFGTKLVASLYFDSLLKKHNFLETSAYPEMETKLIKQVA